MKSAIVSLAALLTSICVIFTPTAAFADEDQQTNLHYQATTISQQHGDFPAAYSGKNSMSPTSDTETSITTTIFFGQRLWPTGEIYIDPELSGGSGFNKTTGAAGFPNGDIYRVDDPLPKWSLARLYYQQVFGFGSETEILKDDKNQLAGSVATDRLTVVLGKFALNDFFDTNTYAHDPRTQFLNWAFMDNAAWDYAADTRGYSWGFYLEYNQPRWALRFASVLVPQQANQLQMETNYPTYRGDNLELEYRYHLGEHPGATRFLIYENHANMGNYRLTINSPEDNMDVTQSRSLSLKYGFGLNVEQEVSEDLGAFGRISWDDGHTETWAFTEVDQTISAGLSLKGHRWKRPEDVIGMGLIINGLSNDHRDYLDAGGVGFIIGDSAQPAVPGQTLNYGYEQIGEVYYLFKAMKGLDGTLDYQYIQNPAYNKDRGPVSVSSLRVHFEI